MTRPAAATAPIRTRRRNGTRYSQAIPYQRLPYQLDSYHRLPYQRLPYQRLPYQRLPPHWLSYQRLPAQSEVRYSTASKTRFWAVSSP